jgi:hypothetical protein
LEVCVILYWVLTHYRCNNQVCVCKVLVSKPKKSLMETNVWNWTIVC